MSRGRTRWFSSRIRLAIKELLRRSILARADALRVGGAIRSEVVIVLVNCGADGCGNACRVEKGGMRHLAGGDVLEYDLPLLFLAEL